MKRLAFSPSTINVAKGETVRFRFRNDDTTVHEAVIGDDDTQRDHEKEMNSSKDSMGGHDMGGMDDRDAIQVQAGTTGAVTYTFDKTGIVLIGCHEPGHYAACMKATIKVS